MSDLSDHPLVADRLAKLRNKSCPSHQFRQHVSDIAKLLVLPATAGLATEPTKIETPLQEMTAKKLSRQVVLVPILRAGLGLSDAFHQMIPEASVAHYGVARNEETLEPEIYLEKFPSKMDQAEVIILDPMLATGGSAVAALDGLKERGARHLHFVCLVASPEGLARVKHDHPEVIITCATIDDGLNEQGYIVPGLGDAGDRTFGTL